MQHEVGERLGGVAIMGRADARAIGLGREGCRAIALAHQAPHRHDAQYREDFCRMSNPTAILNRSLLINACAFITNTLRIRKKTSTPALRERFDRRPSLALRLLMNPFCARLDP